MPLSRARESGLHIPKAAPRQGVPFLLTLCARTGTSREAEKASSHGCQKLTQRTAPETAGKAALPAPLRRASSLPYSKYPKPEGGRTVLRLFCGRFAHCPHARRRNAVRPGLSLFLCRAPDPLRPAPSTVPPLKGKREYLFRRKTFTKKNTCEKIIHKPVKPTTSPVCQRGKVQH